MDSSADSFIRLGILLIAITSFMFMAVSAFRTYYLSVEEMRKQLKVFSVENTVAHCCTQQHKDASGKPIPICDKETISACIVNWFGSIETFNQRVQEKMQLALVPQLGYFSFSYSWMVACSMPVLWAYFPKVAYAAFNEDWTFAAQQVFWIMAWWLGALPIMTMSILAVSKVLSQRYACCTNFLANLIASWVVLPIYIGIELWLGFASTILPTLVADVVYASTLIIIAVLLAIAMACCRRRVEGK